MVDYDSFEKGLYDVSSFIIIVLSPFFIFAAKLKPEYGARAGVSIVIHVGALLIQNHFKFGGWGTTLIALPLFACCCYSWAVEEYWLRWFYVSLGVSSGAVLGVGVVCVLSLIPHLTDIPLLPLLIITGGGVLVGGAAWRAGERSLPFTAAFQGAFLAIACISWISYRMGDESAPIFWVTEFLLLKTKASSFKNGWDIAPLFMLVLLLVSGLLVQEMFLRVAEAVSETRKKRKFQRRAEREGELIPLVQFDLTPQQEDAVTQMRIRLEQESALSVQAKAELTNLKAEMKTMMDKRNVKDDGKKKKKSSGS